MLPQVGKVPTKPGVFLLNNSQILPQVSWILLAWFMSFHQAWDLRLRQWVSNSYGSLTQKFKTIAGASQPCAMSTWLIRILDDTRLISSCGQFLLYCSLLHPTNVCSHRSLPCTVSPEDHLSCDIGSRSSGSDCQAGVVLGSLNSHHNGHMKSRGKNDASSQIHDTAPVSHTLDITWHLDISWLSMSMWLLFPLDSQCQAIAGLQNCGYARLLNKGSPLPPGIHSVEVVVWLRECSDPFDHTLYSMLRACRVTPQHSSKRPMWYTSRRVRACSFIWFATMSLFRFFIVCPVLPLSEPALAGLGTRSYSDSLTSPYTTLNLN